ncbi:MAG: hypothetical protein ACOC4Y_01000 [bacterium]
MKFAERIIVYSLLFVALFMGFKGQNFGQANTSDGRNIVAEKITIPDDNGEPLVEIGKEDGRNNRKKGVIEVKSREDAAKITGGVIVSALDNDNYFMAAGPSIQLKNDNLASMKIGREMNLETYGTNFGLFLRNDERNKAAAIALNDRNGGIFELCNEKGDISISLSQNKDSGHGLINVFDKYGENSTTYSHRGY